MTAPDWVAPSTSFAVVLLGAAAGWVTSEVRLKRERREVSDRQRFQIHLAARELTASLSQIEAGTHGLQFLDEDLVYDQPQRPGAWDRTDRYYLKYDLVDAVYRLCALLGWMEIYRSDPTFLLGARADRSRLEGAFAAVRGALAGARPGGPAAAFILEEDQRAIGEQMAAGRPAMVIGYARFCERLFRLPERDDPVGGGATSQNHWVWNATLFVLDFKPVPPGSTRGADDPRQACLRHLLTTLRALVAASA